MRAPRLALSALALSLGLASSACTEIAEHRASEVEPNPTTTTPAPTGVSLERCTGCTPAAFIPPSTLPDAASSELCLPQAVAYDLESQIPAFPAELIDTLCSAPTTPITTHDGGTALTFSYNPETRTVTRASVRASATSTTTFTLDEDGQPRTIVSEGGGGFYGAGAGRTEYRLNAEGQLVYKLSYDGFSPLVLEKEQRWDGDRLLERIERDGPDGPTLRHWTWTYDTSGRLILASLNDFTRERSQSAAWTYTDSGLPESVTRSVNDTPVITETWDWSQDDALLGRSYAVVGTHMLNPDDPESMAYIQGLDTLELQPEDYMSDPWASAVSIDTGACRTLPHGPGHGYPNADGVFTLGAELEQRPSGLGFAYGYNGYGWNYGDLSWYGHLGIGTMWPGRDGYQRHASLHFEVRYDAHGRMISESILRTLADASTDSVQRHRTYDAHGVATDTLSLDETTYTLTFDRDTSGNLVRRDARLNNTLFQHQTWSYDGAGQMLGFELFVDATLEPAEGPDFEALIQSWHSDSLLAPEHPSYAAFYAYDDQGRVIERGVLDASNRHETLVYDDQDRVIERTGSFNQDHHGGTTHFTFDNEGRLLESCNASGESTTCTTHTFDDLGRLLQSQHQRDTQISVFEQRAYLCAR